MWFRNKLRHLGDQPVTFTVRSPLYSMADSDSTSLLESTVSMAPSIAPYSYHERQASLKSVSSIGAYDRSGTALNEQSHLRGKEVFNKNRASVQLKGLEKLGRCRVVFQCINQQDAITTQDIQRRVFNIEDAKYSTNHGDVFQEYHIHVRLSEQGSSRCSLIRDGCSLRSPESICDFEMHETMTRVIEKTAVDPNQRVDVLSLPNDVSSGPVSVEAFKRFSAEENLHTNNVHLEVLSINGPKSAAIKNWCSPIFYCKHSVNVLVVDCETFFSNPNLELELARVLCEIDTYCCDHTAVGPHPPSYDTRVDGKVLLVLTNRSTLEYVNMQLLQEAVMSVIKPHQSRVLQTLDGWSFVLDSDIDAIRSMLVREIDSVSMNGADNKAYPHIAVEVSQQLKSNAIQFIERSDLKQRLEQLLIDKSNADMALDGTLHYLQNMGLAYVPSELMCNYNFMFVSPNDSMKS